MKNNDISNQVGYVFAVRYEDCLSQTVPRFKNFKHLFFKRVLNPDVLSLIRYIYRHTEFTVEVVISRKNLTEAVRNELSEVPFSEYIPIDDEEDITLRLNGGDISYYVDENAERRGLLNSQHAIDRLQAWNIVRRGVS